MARAHGRKAPALESHVEVRRDELHVVVQNGRLFQQHNPDVPVIHDRGRYLLVKLEPARARKLASSHPTCYGVSPLAEREVVFEAQGAGVAARASAPFVREAVDRLQRASLEASLNKLSHSRQDVSNSVGCFRRSKARAEDAAKLKQVRQITEQLRLTIFIRAVLRAWLRASSPLILFSCPSLIMWSASRQK